MADTQILLNNTQQAQIVCVPNETIALFELVDVSGIAVTKESLIQKINEIRQSVDDQITCIGFVCSNKLLDKALYLCKHIKLTTEWKTVWYNNSGIIPIDSAFKTLQWLDYIFMNNNSSIASQFKVRRNENGFELIEIV